jgi:hypothetical protein
LGVEALKNHFNPTGKFLPFCRCRVEHKRGRIHEVSFAVKYWEIIIENLRNAGWNCGCMATTDGKGRPIWVVAAERTATTENALLCVQIKSCLPVSNSNPQFKTTGHDHGQNE